MLHDDDFNVREYVVQVLLKVVPVLTVDVAVRYDIERTMNITNHVHTYIRIIMMMIMTGMMMRRN